MPYYTKEGKELIPARDVPEEALLAIERADEQSIIESMTTPEKQKFFAYAYEIITKDGPRQVIGISVDGAVEIARQLGNIEVLSDLKVEEKDDYFYAMVRARDLLRNTTLLGVGRQCKFQLGKGNLPDKERPNEWAFVQAVSKGQRNAILAVAPQEAVIGIVEKLKPEYIKKLSPPTTSNKDVREEKPKEEKVSQADLKEVINLYAQSKGWDSSNLNQSQKDDITKFFTSVTGKTGKWTKTDIEKMRAEIAKLPQQSSGDLETIIDEL